MSVSCQILINRVNGGHPGQPVSGVLRYTLNEPLEVKSVVLSLIGSGQCQWSETKSKNDESETKHYYGKEEYFRESVSVDNKDSDKFTIPAGAYEFPYNFCLPWNIPPSFKNHCGSISYVLLLTFKRPGIFQFDRKFVAEIPVRSFIPSEPDPLVIFGLEKILTKPFSSRKHIVKVKAEIAKCSLSPGGSAQLALVVKNDTGVKIKAIKCELVRYKTYTADCGEKRYDHFIVRGSMMQSPSIPKNSVVNLTQEIPISLDMYSVMNSRVIKVEFKVRVTVCLPLPHINPSVEVPVIIGDRLLEQETDDPPSYWKATCVEENDK